MARGTNIEQTRAYNRRAIMQTLHRHGTASRTEIARITSLSLQAVSNIIFELAEEGLVISRGRRATGRGQPPVDYALNPEGSYSIGLSVDLDHMAGLLVNAGGEVIASRRLELDSAEPGSTIDGLANLTRELRAELPAREASRLIGVTLGVPGVVEEDGGVIARMVRLEKWEGLRVGDLLAERLASPVRVANDAALAALGERWFGPGRDLDTFFYVLFALGMGSSLILGGEPYGGTWGHLGRLGHIPVEPGGKPCPSCGGSGCLSLYTSLGALQEHLAGHKTDASTAMELVALHREGNEQLASWLHNAAHYLARGLVVLENLLAPNVIIFGGRMPRPILEELISVAGEHYRRQRAPLRSDAARLVLGREDEEAVTIGAAALPHYLATAANYQLVQHR